jgi:hypothetical protein
MGWGLAADWLAVVGLLFLTIGTTAQALASLRDFNGLKREASPKEAMNEREKLEVALRSLSGQLLVTAVAVWSPFVALSAMTDSPGISGSPWSGSSS